MATAPTNLEIHVDGHFAEVYGTVKALVDDGLILREWAPTKARKRSSSTKDNCPGYGDAIHEDDTPFIDHERVWFWTIERLPFRLVKLRLMPWCTREDGCAERAIARQRRIVAARADAAFQRFRAAAGMP